MASKAAGQQKDSGINGMRGVTMDSTGPIPSLQQPVRLDAVDRLILEHLSYDGRATYADLARLAGLSPPSVQDRVKRLEERGFIAGYRAVVPAHALGLGVAALVEVVQSDYGDQEAVVGWLEQVPEIEDCWSVAGEASFMVKVRVSDVEALEGVLGKLRQITGVSRTRTTVILSTRWESRGQLESHLDL